MAAFRLIFLVSVVLPIVGAADAPPSQFVGKCRHVVDGDSLYIEGQKKQIRLWGVDAPERGEKGYGRATRNLKRLALGRELHCTLMDIDRYQRIVARCHLERGASKLQLDINREQINLPHVREYCRFTRNFYGQCRDTER